MKRLAFLVVPALILFAATPAWPSARSCNTTLVSQQICRSSTNLVLFYDAPAAAFAELRDAMVAEGNYQAELVCAPARQFTPLLNSQPSKVVSAAGVAQGDCSTVGQVTPNPQAESEFADGMIDLILRNKVIAWKHNTAQEAANDPSSIPTPDVGGGN